MRLPFSPLLLAAALAAGPVLGHDVAPTFERAAFSVSASSEVANDTLTAVLAAQRDGPSPRKLGVEVNQAMAWALARAKEVPSVQAQTLDYRTQPIYQKGAMSGWRVTQSLRLESRDTAALADLVGALQEQLVVQQIDYEVSRERRRTAEDQLIAEAIAGFEARAKRVAEGLKRRGWRLVRLDLNTGGGPMPMPRMRTMAAVAEAAPPAALEAGNQTLTVTASGEIELTPD
jgi:predicted secreted protein